MAQISCEAKLINPVRLRAFCAAVFKATGLAGADALRVADSLVESNLRGIDSHGVARMPHYMDRIRHGSIKARPEMRFERLGQAVGKLEGGDGLGQLVMWRAMEEAVSLAGEAGTGWVAVSDSSHCGALAYYGLEMARRDMIGIVFTHVDPMVLPQGSREPFCGTNPICLTVPGADGNALCLDMATSIVPWNTVANAAMENVPIPLGWAVDGAGKDTSDADEVAALYPFGGYKGSGLGLMIDVLCSMLGGAPFGPHIPKMYGNPEERRQLGGLVGAISIRHFFSPRVVRARVETLIKEWGQLRPMEPGGHVLFPGEPELRCREERLRSGVPLGLQLLEKFHALAQDFQIKETLHDET